MWLEAGGERFNDHNVQGVWFGAPGSIQPCPVLAIDAVPQPPRAHEVPAGRLRAEIVYRTPRMPERAIVSIARDSDAQRVKAELDPRRSASGEIVAWVSSFTVRVRDGLDVLPVAIWRDEHGCGRELLETHFRLR